MEQNHCDHLKFLINIILARFDPEVILLLQSKFRLKQSKVREEMSKIDFQDGGRLGFSISSFSYFVSTRRPCAHHEALIQLDSRRDVQNMNSQHFSHINV